MSNLERVTVFIYLKYVVNKEYLQVYIYYAIMTS